MRGFYVPTTNKQTSIPRGSWSPLHAGQQETAAGAAMALLISSPSATTALARHIFTAAERVPHPRRRLSLLADIFFALLVRAARGGRAPRAKSSSGGNGGVSSGSGMSGKGWGFHRRQVGRNGGRAGTGERLRRLLVVSVLEEDWFVELVSEPPTGARRQVFREEMVAALTTACAQARRSNCAAAVVYSTVVKKPKFGRASPPPLLACPKHAYTHLFVFSILGSQSVFCT